MRDDEMSNAIAEMQISNDYVIMDNTFSNPKFVKQLTKNEFELAKTDTYVLKLFTELLSRLNFDVLQNTTELNQIKIELNIKDFLQQIGVEHSKGYRYVIDSVIQIRGISLQWKESGIYKDSAIVSFSEHNPKTGKINLFMPQQFVKRVLEVGMKENFSFLKQNLFKLDNNQAIKLYQFFKSWQNKGVYQIDLQRFREQFGYNTSGYDKFSNLESRVLKPATQEITDKTDIIVSYKLVGENLESKRKRVSGLIFTIKAKGKDTKQLPNGERHQTPQPQDEQTHISNIIPQVIPIQQKEHKASHNQPSQAEIIELGEKAKLTTPQIEKIQELYRTNIRAWEAIKAYLTAPNKATIQNTFAYIIDHKSINTLGVGLWETEKEKIIKKQKHDEEEHNKKLHETIKAEYTKRNNELYTKLYNEATEKEKAEVYETIKNNPKNIVNGRNFKIDDKGELKFFAISEAGAILAEKRNYGLEVRQNEFREEMFRKFNLLVNYDQNDMVLIIPNLFQEQKPIEQEPEEQAPLLPYSPEKEIKNEFSEKEQSQNLKKHEAKKRQPKKIEDKKTIKHPTEQEAKQPQPQAPTEPMPTASQQEPPEQTPEMPIMQRMNQANSSNNEPLHIGNILERTFSKFFKK